MTQTRDFFDAYLALEKLQSKTYSTDDIETALSSTQSKKAQIESLKKTLVDMSVETVIAKVSQDESVAVIDEKISDSVKSALSTALLKAQNPEEVTIAVITNIDTPSSNSNSYLVRSVDELVNKTRDTMLSPQATQNAEAMSSSISSAVSSFSTSVQRKKVADGLTEQITSNSGSGYDQSILSVISNHVATMFESHGIIEVDDQEAAKLGSHVLSMASELQAMVTKGVDIETHKTLDKELSATKNKLEAAIKEIDSKQEKIDEQARALIETQTQLHTATASLTETQSQLAEMASSLTDTQKQLDDLKSSNLAQENQKLQDQIKKLQEESAKLTSSSDPAAIIEASLNQLKSNGYFGVLTKTSEASKDGIKTIRVEFNSADSSKNQSVKSSYEALLKAENPSAKAKEISSSREKVICEYSINEKDAIKYNVKHSDEIKTMDAAAISARLEEVKKMITALDKQTQFNAAVGEAIEANIDYLLIYGVYNNISINAKVLKKQKDNLILKYKQTALYNTDRCSNSKTYLSKDQSNIDVNIIELKNALTEEKDILTSYLSNAKHEESVAKFKNASTVSSSEKLKLSTQYLETLNSYLSEIKHKNFIISKDLPKVVDALYDENNYKYLDDISSVDNVFNRIKFINSINMLYSIARIVQLTAESDTSSQEYIDAQNSYLETPLMRRRLEQYIKNKGDSTLKNYLVSHGKVIARNATTTISLYDLIKPIMSLSTNPLLTKTKTLNELSSRTSKLITSFDTFKTQNDAPKKILITEDAPIPLISRIDDQFYNDITEIFNTFVKYCATLDQNIFCITTEKKDASIPNTLKRISSATKSILFMNYSDDKFWNEICKHLVDNYKGNLSPINVKEGSETKTFYPASSDFTPELVKKVLLVRRQFPQATPIIYQEWLSSFESSETRFVLNKLSQLKTSANSASDHSDFLFDQVNSVLSEFFNVDKISDVSSLINVVESLKTSLLSDYLSLLETSVSLESNSASAIPTPPGIPAPPSAPPAPPVAPPAPPSAPPAPPSAPPAAPAAPPGAPTTQKKASTTFTNKDATITTAGSSDSPLGVPSSLKGKVSGDSILFDQKTYPAIHEFLKYYQVLLTDIGRVISTAQTFCKNIFPGQVSDKIKAFIKFDEKFDTNSSFEFLNEEGKSNTQYQAAYQSYLNRIKASGATNEVLAIVYDLKKAQDKLDDLQTKFEATPMLLNTFSINSLTQASTNIETAINDVVAKISAVDPQEIIDKINTSVAQLIVSPIPDPVDKTVFIDANNQTYFETLLSKAQTGDKEKDAVNDIITNVKLLDQIRSDLNSASKTPDELNQELKNVQTIISTIKAALSLAITLDDYVKRIEAILSQSLTAQFQSANRSLIEKVNAIKTNIESKKVISLKPEEIQSIKSLEEAWTDYQAKQAQKAADEKALIDKAAQIKKNLDELKQFAEDQKNRISKMTLLGASADNLPDDNSIKQNFKNGVQVLTQYIQSCITKLDHYSSTDDVSLAKYDLSELEYIRTLSNIPDDLTNKVEDLLGKDDYNKLLLVLASCTSREQTIIDANLKKIDSAFEGLVILKSSGGGIGGGAPISTDSELLGGDEDNIPSQTTAVVTITPEEYAIKNKLLEYISSFTEVCSLDTIINQLNVNKQQDATEIITKLNQLKNAASSNNIDLFYQLANEILSYRIYFVRQYIPYLTTVSLINNLSNEGFDLASDDFKLAVLTEYLYSKFTIDEAFSPHETTPPEEVAKIARSLATILYSRGVVSSNNLFDSIIYSDENKTVINKASLKLIDTAARTLRYEDSENIDTIDSAEQNSASTATYKSTLLKTLNDNFNSLVSATTVKDLLQWKESCDALLSQLKETSNSDTSSGS